MDLYKLDLSRFIFQEKIGVGNQSKCLLNIEKETEAKYAAILSRYSSSNNPIVIDKFLGQIKILSMLSCPLFPNFFGYSMKINDNYINTIIITEYIPNGTLDHIISMDPKDYGESKWTDTKKLINIYGIAFGMSYLHSLNIIHRDITTKSVLLDEHLYPKIINFASALDLSDKIKASSNFTFSEEKNQISNLNDDENSKMSDIEEEEKGERKFNDDKSNTKKEKNIDDDEKNFDYEKFFGDVEIIHVDDSIESFVGTPSYRAPEIWENMKYSKSSDVFAFSIVVYEILTSQFPYRFKGTHQLAKYVVEGGRPDINSNEIPDCFIDLMRKCWDSDPEKRPTFDEIVTEIKTNKRFITGLNIDEEEFRSYQKLIESKQNDAIVISKKERNVSNDIDEIDLSNYQIEKYIDQGSFSNVYKINDIKTNDVYAAKISMKTINDFSDFQLISLNREISILSKLNFPSIIKFIGYNKRNFKNRLKPTIITEFVKNQSLEDVILFEKNSCDAINLNDTKKLIAIYGIASAMSYLHSLNIIHRDIKPSNIFLDEYFYPKIGDFGLSKEINNNNENDNNDDGDEFYVGSLIYMAPEILTNNKYHKAGDVYSFALVVYYIITFEPPYKGFKYIDIIKRVPEGIRPEFNSSTTGCYRDLIEKCWSNDYEKRPTFDEIVHTLKTNPDFITENIDKDEFLNYIEYIENSSNSPESNNTKKFHPVSFDIDHLKELERIRETEEMKSLIGEPFVDLNNYEKCNLISKDENSKIYEVKNKETGILYAAIISNTVFKNLSSDDLINLSREVNIVSKLNHPTLLKFIGYSPIDFKSRKKPVIISELPSNLSLSQILDKERCNEKIDNWNDTQKLICLYGISLGMSYIHSNDIIHRNLNTKSIFFDENLNPKIGNLGLLTKSNRICSLSCKTATNLKENLLYSSPDLLETNEYSKSSDVCAFALIVYEMMTLKTFTNINDLKESINSNKLETNDSIPKSYLKLIEDCWSQNRPTFDQIVSMLKKEAGFITENVDKELFDNYVESFDNEMDDYNSEKKDDGKSQDENSNDDERSEKSESVTNIEQKDDETKDYIENIKDDLTEDKMQIGNEENVNENDNGNIADEENFKEAEDKNEIINKINKEDEGIEKNNVDVKDKYEEIIILEEEEEEHEDENKKEEDSKEKDKCEEASTKEDKCEEASNKEDKCEEASNKEDKCEEASNKEDKCEEASNKEDKCEEASNKEDKFKEASNKEDKCKEASNKEDKCKEASNKEDKFKEASNKEDKCKEASNKEDKFKEASNKEDKCKEASNKEDKCKEASNKEDKFKEASNKEDKCKEASNKEDKQGGIDREEERENANKTPDFVDEKSRNTKNKGNDVNQNDYIEIEDQNCNYAEKIREIKRKPGNQDQVLKISFKFNSSNFSYNEKSDSDIDKDEDMIKEESKMIKSRSKRPTRKRRKARKARRKPNANQDDKERKTDNGFAEEEDEDDNFIKELEKLMEEEEDKLSAEEEKLIKEQEENKRKEEERLMKENEERLRRERAEKLRKEVEERLKKEKEEEKLRREKEERIKKEEEERIKKEKEEKIKKEEERIKKEKDERIKKEEERIKKEKLRKEREEMLRKERIDKLRKEREERLKKEEEEKLRREKEERLKKEEEEKIRKEKEEKLKKEGTKDSYADLLAKYKDVENVVVMQLIDEPKNDIPSSSDKERKTSPSTNFQPQNSPVKSPSKPKGSPADSFSRQPPSPPFQKSKFKGNTIKLTVTLKDIGMAEFDPNNGSEIQAKSTQDSSASNEKELPKLNHNNKGNVQSQDSSNSPPQTENKLPKLVRSNQSSASIKKDQNQSDSFAPADHKLINRSPRRHKEGASNYNPNVFRSPPDNFKSNKAQATRDFIKSPIKLTVTLKDIGMEGLDSSTPGKT
ncbi:hypothetical protein M9Y10_025157 [Tritrichomonas musculus]|uniref:Protein kinase domain-containing protein n=1 Tax=Tritrichomonas musculus TaxID=1915356 RepID=A0ABR2HAU9_9EUKA